VRSQLSPATSSANVSLTQKKSMLGPPKIEQFSPAAQSSSVAQRGPVVFRQTACPLAAKSSMQMPAPTLASQSAWVAQVGMQKPPAWVRMQVVVGSVDAQSSSFVHDSEQ
jgi:hypothetical protein